VGGPVGPAEERRGIEPSAGPPARIEPRNGDIVTQTAIVNSNRHQRHAAALLLITAVLWLHEWLAALLVVGWVAWLILHRRLEGALGDNLVRLWRRVWPPGPVLLVLLLAANAVLYWVYAPIPGKIMPIALNVVGLSMVLFGSWWTRLARPPRFQGAPVAAAAVSVPVSTKA